MFEKFEKIPRLCRDVTITEKIDGTNAQVLIMPEGLITSEAPTMVGNLTAKVTCPAGDVLHVYAGSRNRFIQPGKDNFGFAAWVLDHAEELAFGLGVGRHFGEWWGYGIQRGYGLDHKRFSLFNTKRWGAERPECCSVVPVLYEGLYTPDSWEEVLADLEKGSKAAPGFPLPEGVIMYHKASNGLFKYTFNGDGHKG